MTQQLQLLLEKYGAGTLSEQEERTLLDLLSTGEQSLADWSENAYDTDLEKNAVYLTGDHSARLLQQIQARKKYRPRLLYRRIAVAAAAVLVLAVGMQLLLRTTGNNRKAGGFSHTTGLPVQQRRQLQNTTGAAISYCLSDSSVVALQPGGVVAYNEPFDRTKRDLFLLTGKALFTVAGDAQRPFTVYAGTTATTALGTSFTVESQPASRIVIQLLDGKVVVRSAKLHWKAVYLHPGEQAMADSNAATCKVSRFMVPGILKPAPAQSVVQPDKEELVFRKVPLPQVFQQLGKKYNVVIVSNPKQLQGLVFTGHFTNDESLQSVLSVITGLNNLSSHQEKDTIFINKE